MNTEQRNFGLDLVRTLAIMLVLLAHFAKEVEGFGFWGVELFFALSGFLIGHILWRSFSVEGWSLAHISNFWKRRWWRTLPNYYLFFILTIPLHVFIFNYIPQPQELADSLWFGQNLLSRNSRFYGVSWSLCIEEWFYLLFPLVLLLTSRFIRSKRLSFVLTVFFFVAFSIAMRYWLAENGRQETLRTITFSRLDSIAYGVLVAFLHNQHFMNFRLKMLMLCAGILLVLAPVATSLLASVTFASLRQNQLMLLIVPIGCALMIPAAALIPRPARFLAGPVEKISQWSYSIYLSHMPVLFMVYEAMSAFRGSFAGNMFSKFVGFAATIAISAVVYRYFEVPLLKKRPRELTVRTPAPEPALGNA